MRVLIIILISISLFTQSGCNALKYKKVDAKEFPPDPKLRIKKNMEEGRGFRIMDTVKNKEEHHMNLLVQILYGKQL